MVGPSVAAAAASGVVDVGLIEVGGGSVTTVMAALWAKPGLNRLIARSKDSRKARMANGKDDWKSWCCMCCANLSPKHLTDNDEIR
jgi:hypothetical protein